MDNILWITHRFTIWMLLLIPLIAYSVSVTITKEEDSPGNIEVKKGVKELRVDNGEDIGITCAVEGDTDFTWALWSLNGLALTFNLELLASHKARYRLEQRNNNGKAEFTLKINNVQLKDEGNYTCQGLGGLVDSIGLFVTTRPNITVITGLQTAQVGDNVQLQCKAEGSPKPAIRWRHVRPNHQLPNGIEGSYKQSDTLDIRSISLEDRGEYQCIASNGVLHSQFASLSRTSFIRMDYPPTVEPIFDDFQVVRVAGGSSASLICRSLAYPRSSDGDVVWFFDGAPDSDNKQLSNGNNGYQWDVVHQLPKTDVDPYEETTFSTLDIADVNNSTIGQYRCQFKNSRGTSHAVILVEFAPVEGGVADTSKSKANVLRISLFMLLSMLLATLGVFC
ncbi:limbic system-associated membrane protein-like [Amphiura filiformis]|uniref:limbic system-associated membrane protein-like n=1 Tax=Amphiura filiformis TaxID=82378 RepID=UPI003B20B688